MKLLIVSGLQATREAFALLTESFGFEEIIQVDHEQALERFLETEPTHVLVCEYEDGAQSGKFAVARQQTWIDLTASAMPEQRLLRTGFMECSAPDFLRLPFSPNDLRRAFGI